MSAISQAEARISERASDAPMLEQVQAWAAINSGTRNLRGLADMAAELVNAFSSLPRSEEHTSELQSLMRISYAVFCLKKKQTQTKNRQTQNSTQLSNNQKKT